MATIRERAAIAASAANKWNERAVRQLLYGDAQRAVDYQAIARGFAAAYFAIHEQADREEYRDCGPDMDITAEVMVCK